MAFDSTPQLDNGMLSDTFAARNPGKTQPWMRDPRETSDCGNLTEAVGASDRDCKLQDRNTSVVRNKVGRKVAPGLVVAQSTTGNHKNSGHTSANEKTVMTKIITSSNGTLVGRVVGGGRSKSIVCADSDDEEEKSGHGKNIG